jgi:hypothetical protein
MPGFLDVLGSLATGAGTGIETGLGIAAHQEEQRRKRTQDLMARKLQEAQLSDYQRRAEEARRSDQEAQEQKAQLDIEAADVLHRYPELAEQYGTDFRPGGGARTNIENILQAGRERAAREEEQRMREQYPEQFISPTVAGARIRAGTEEEEEDRLRFQAISRRAGELMREEELQSDRAWAQATLEWEQNRGGTVTGRQFSEARGEAFDDATLEGINRMAADIAAGLADGELLLAQAMASGDELKIAAVRRAIMNAEQSETQRRERESAGVEPERFRPGR